MVGSCFDSGSGRDAGPSGSAMARSPRSPVKASPPVPAAERQRSGSSVNAKPVSSSTISSRCSSPSSSERGIARLKAWQPSPTPADAKSGRKREAIVRTNTRSPSFIATTQRCDGSSRCMIQPETSVSDTSSRWARKFAEAASAGSSNGAAFAAGSPCGPVCAIGGAADPAGCSPSLRPTAALRDPAVARLLGARRVLGQRWSAWDSHRVRVRAAAAVRLPTRSTAARRVGRYLQRLAAAVRCRRLAPLSELRGRLRQRGCDHQGIIHRGIIPGGGGQATPLAMLHRGRHLPPHASQVTDKASARPARLSNFMFFTTPG